MDVSGWAVLQLMQFRLIDDYSKYPFPSPDWYFSNQSWVDQQLALYYENRTGEYPSQSIPSK